MTKPVNISLILKTANDLPNKELRIEYLRNTYSELMRKIVEGAYHPAVEWLLPKGIPAYTPTKNGSDVEYMLYKEYPKFYIFVKGGNDNIKQHRRENIFIQLLESIHADDAKLLLTVKDKYLPYPNLTYEFFQECFPGILPDRIKPAIIPVVPIYNMIETPKIESRNKGKIVVNDGKKNFLVSKEEAGKYTLGRLKK